MSDIGSKQESTAKSSQTTTPKRSSNKSMLLIGVVIVTLVLLGSGGYLANKFFAQEVAEKAIETATGGKADVENDGNKVTIETNDQKLTIGTDEVPKNFPKGLTIYKGAKVTASTESADSVSVQLTTTDSVSTVHDFYKNDLKKNGWTETSNTTYQDSAAVSGEKSGSSVIITITRDPDKDNTIISIIHVSSK